MSNGLKGLTLAAGVIITCILYLVYESVGNIHNLNVFKSFNPHFHDINRTDKYQYKTNYYTPKFSKNLHTSSTFNTLNNLLK